MKRFFPIICWLLVTPGILSVWNSRPCRAQTGQTPLEEKTDNDKPAKPIFAPGKVTRVHDDALGEKGYYRVYLPEDYTTKHTWPVLFCYHRMNSQPTVEPFRTILKGKHFVLVGMGYHKPGREGYESMKTKDVERLKHVMRAVEKYVRVNRDMLFVGGFSKGAFYAAGMLNNVPEVHWAGGVLLGGGMNEPVVPRRRKSLYKLPVFLACGQADPHRQYVETAADHFRDMKSDVTVEIWPNTEHVDTYPGSRLEEWLIEKGPLRDATDRLARAKVNENAGKPGLALEEYESLAHVDPGNVICQQAQIAAKALSARAKEKMDRATKAETKKDYDLAQNLLAELTVDFKGSHFGNQADERLEKLRSDPAVQKEITRRKNQTAAEKLKQKAILAKKDGRYSEAIRLYEQYLWMYPNVPGAKEVKKELEKLRSDENLQKRIRDQRAAHDCRGWLNMADAYIEQGRTDKAKSFLDRIIRKYPDTTWALKARVRLNNLD